MASKPMKVDGGKGTVFIEGYLKKLKTMKKKYFVLRGESTEASARLEYYDSEKKYRLGMPPKRMISLKTCFNINRRTDTKQKHVIALYTKDDVFCVVLDSEQQVDEWLKLLLQLQTGEENTDGEELRPNFEHIWIVKLQDKGLGSSKNLVGPYYVCLSDQTLTLRKCSKGENLELLEFPLTQIRSCGGTESFFYIEVGRQSITGAGELWMLTPDASNAKNMNDVILSAFTLRQSADPHRKRSSSATESNRPIAPLQRRQTHGGGRPLHASPYSAVPVTSCLPHARVSSLTPRPASQRRHSVSALSSSAVAATHAREAQLSLDLPDNGTTTPSGVWHQRTKSCPVSDSSCIPLIVEPHRVLSQNHVGPVDSDRRGSAGTPSRRPHPFKSSSGIRERSDSMPSRNRTTSEGTHKVHPRPASVHVRGVSYSPPGPCSTDSAGSSLSIDETDGERYIHPGTPDERIILEENPDDAMLWPNDNEMDLEALDKQSASLSLPIHSKTSQGVSHGSPYSSNFLDYTPMSPADSSRRVRPSTSPSAADYLPMSPGDYSKRGILGSSPAAAANSDYLPMSPGEMKIGINETSPTTAASDYMTMSPVDTKARGQSTSMDYLPMSPGDTSQRVHSRGSSLADDGYVPMAPLHSDDGYVDMDPAPARRFLSDDNHSDMSPSSSCSVTSGTPSTDHYILEKVSAYFTPSEEEDGSTTDRPARTYSFGSQPKGRLEVMNAAEAARVRAFSVGTRPRPETHKLAARTVPPGSKFSSAPLLSSSWSGSSRHQVQDPMADHMEIDFTKKRGSRLKGLPVVESLSSQATSSADSGYMDMSSKSPPRPSPPKVPSTKHLFSPPDGKTMGTRLIKPAIISSSTLKTIGERPDIKPQKFPTTSSANINILPNKIHAPEKPYVEMRGWKSARSGSESKTDGYMDMTVGNTSAKLTRKSSSESMNDYLSMSCGKCSSQPITIRSSTLSGYSARKSSSTTPPKPPSFLALGAASASNLFSNIGKNTERKSRKKQKRRGSKENATTPTGIFPLSLNSPLSPKKAYPTENEVCEVETAAEPEGTNLAVPLSRVLRICSKENSPSEVTNLPVDDGDYAVMRPCSQPQRKPPSTVKPCEDSISRVVPSGRPPSSPRPPDKPPEPDGSKRLAPLAKPEDVRVKPGPSGSESGEPHSGVSRQVSTSSSSSTEVMSVKDGAECDIITYASLDLGSENEEPRSPRPSPTPGPFTYTEIDFEKSESLRAPQPLNKKIRH